MLGRLLSRQLVQKLERSGAEYELPQQEPRPLVGQREENEARIVPIAQHERALPRRE
jgi:hypothetical protein